MTEEVRRSDTPTSAQRGKRIPVPKSVRFEVFKRDSFTCQYCGGKAPDVVLHVDHIEAVVAGGSNDLLNLVTACDACNLGKSDRSLSDHSALERQRMQLAQLQERREQLSMMVDWRRELLNLKDEAATEAAQYWSDICAGFTLTPSGEQTVKGWLRSYSIDEILQAMEIAVENHVDAADEPPSQRSAEAAWKSIPGTLRMLRLKEQDPVAARLRYIRGIMRKRFHYCPLDVALQKLEDASAAGIAIEQLEKIAKRARNWTSWERMLQELIEERVGAQSPVRELALLDTLLEPLRHLDDRRRDQLAGYARGLAIVDAAVACVDTEDEEEAERLRRAPPLPHEVSCDSEPQAAGFGDALGLLRTSRRAELLVEMGVIDHDTVWRLLRNEVPKLPCAPFLVLDATGALAEVIHPLAAPE